MTEIDGVAISLSPPPPSPYIEGLIPGRKREILYIMMVSQWVRKAISSKHTKPNSISRNINLAVNSTVVKLTSAYLQTSVHRHFKFN